MRDPRLQALYGLKFNPFLPDIPLDVLYVSGPTESFLGRCESHMTEGGFRPAHRRPRPRKVRYLAPARRSLVAPA